MPAEDVPAKGLHDVLFGGCEMEEAQVLVRERLLLVASDPRMVTADGALLLEPGSDLKLRRALLEWQKGGAKGTGAKGAGAQAGSPKAKKGRRRASRGHVVIDVPSGWGGMARNAVLAAEHVIVPVNDQMSFDTAIDTTERIRRTCAAYDLAEPRIHILLTAYRDTVHGREVAALCEATWGSQVLAPRIRFSEAVRALALDHKTILDRAAGGAREDYQALAQEVSTWQ